MTEGMKILENLRKIVLLIRSPCLCCAHKNICQVYPAVVDGPLEVVVLAVVVAGLSERKYKLEIDFRAKAPKKLVW